jgi:hypothetical protein
MTVPFGFVIRTVLKRVLTTQAVENLSFTAEAFAARSCPNNTDELKKKLIKKNSHASCKG